MILKIKRLNTKAVAFFLLTIFVYNLNVTSAFPTSLNKLLSEIKFGNSDAGLQYVQFKSERNVDGPERRLEILNFATEAQSAIEVFQEQCIGRLAQFRNMQCTSAMVSFENLMKSKCGMDKDYDKACDIYNSRFKDLKKNS